jgi:hypothetical protein
LISESFILQMIVKEEVRRIGLRTKNVSPADVGSLCVLFAILCDLCG